MELYEMVGQFLKKFSKARCSTEEKLGLVCALFRRIHTVTQRVSNWDEGYVLIYWEKTPVGAPFPPDLKAMGLQTMFSTNKDSLEQKREQMKDTLKERTFILRLKDIWRE